MLVDITAAANANLVHLWVTCHQPRNARVSARTACVRWILRMKRFNWCDLLANFLHFWMQRRILPFMTVDATTVALCAAFRRVADHHLHRSSILRFNTRFSRRVEQCLRGKHTGAAEVLKLARLRAKLTVEAIRRRKAEPSVSYADHRMQLELQNTHAIVRGCERRGREQRATASTKLPSRLVLEHGFAQLAAFDSHSPYS